MATAKITPVEEVVGLIQPRDTLGLGLGPALPGDLLHALGARDDWEELEVFGGLLVDLYELFTRPGVRYVSGFFGPAERFLRDAGAFIEFAPADFRRFKPLLEALSPRVMATVVTPPDDDGYMSLSLHAGATVDEFRRACADPGRMMIVEINANYPRTIGMPPDHPHSLHIDEVDVVLESERDPFVLEDPEPSNADRAIAENVARFIQDGCTLQTGIGAVPSTVVKLLSDGPGGDYGIHSEMFTTGLMHLHQAGKVTNQKGIYDGYSVSTFAAGTRQLYDWLDGNDEVRFLPVELVNSPSIIAQNRRIVTINGALSIDLNGQLIADTIDGCQYSGIGGHEDFVAGPGIELSDRALICLPATATIAGERRSRIVPRFDAGAIVTTPRHQMDVVITEFGAAELQGRTVRERAFALAAIAHPDFRDELMEAAADESGGRAGGK